MRFGFFDGVRTFYEGSDYEMVQVPLPIGIRTEFWCRECESAVVVTDDPIMPQNFHEVSTHFRVGCRKNDQVLPSYVTQAANRAAPLKRWLPETVS
jgi:hypothetical protein